MSPEITGAVIGLATGALAYYFTTFQMDPVLRFREAKHSVHEDLIFFANAINGEGLDAEMHQRVNDRMVSNRRHSAQLRAIFEILPFWYRMWLKLRGVKLRDASVDLIALSNTSDHEKASTRIERICVNLKIPSPYQ